MFMNIDVDMKAPPTFFAVHIYKTDWDSW